MKPGFLAAGLLVLCACTAAGRSQGDSGGAPVIAGIQPETISLGRGAVPTLTVSGSGFAPGGGLTGFADGRNTVRVGRATIEGVIADSTGRTMSFVLPLTYVDTAQRGRPASFVPGVYPVQVSNAHGTSNALNLTMIR
ncbi:MAG: hypothetical protein ACT4OZ_16450 [Gemmatimonadota bacterium]